MKSDVEGGRAELVTRKGDESLSPALARGWPPGTLSLGGSPFADFPEARQLSTEKSVAPAFLCDRPSPYRRCVCQTRLHGWHAPCVGHGASNPVQSSVRAFMLSPTATTNEEES